MKKGLIYILTTALLFSTLEPVSKLKADSLHPLSITFARFFAGGLILLPFSIRKTHAQQIRLTWQNWICMILLGVLCVCVSMPLLQFGVLKGDSPALIAVIFSSNSVFTMVLATVFLKERVTVWKSMAIALCLGGILVCLDFKSGTNALSVALAAAAAVTFSLYTVISKRLTASLSGVIQTSFSFCFGSVALLAVMLITGTGLQVRFDTQSVLILLYLGVAVTGLGYWSYFAAMEKSSAMAASLVFFIKPVLTPFFAFLITGTALTARTFMALALVVAGSVLATRQPKIRRRANW